MNNYTKWDSEVDALVDQLINEYDETYMPVPNIEFEPQLLISKVRKHYMDYMIKILSTNYETNQKLVNKNIYLPSAIWRCAKKLEMKAAQTCMVVQLYRKCIVSMINEVKTDTKKGRLYNKLYKSLRVEPEDEKRTQTTVTGESCCHCTDRKRLRKRSTPANLNLVDLPKMNIISHKVDKPDLLLQEDNHSKDFNQKIPVITNMQTDFQPVIALPLTVPPMIVPPKVVTDQPDLKLMNILAVSPKNNIQESDDVVLQLEKLFQSDDDDDDDLFTNTVIKDHNQTLLNGTLNSTQEPKVNSLNNTQDSIFENHAAQIRSLDERLSTLTGLLINNNEPPVSAKQIVNPVKPKNGNKWHCEEYFLKKNLFEILYQIRDTNRKKLARIKEMYIQLFGEDSDNEEDVVSPDESPDLVASCKSRIDSWVMRVLAPYYAKGHIQGKALYKSVARHLIELIYKCKQYPSRHEVTSFVMDFLENRGKIRCEADFKEFRIDNVHVAHNISF